MEEELIRAVAQEYMDGLTPLAHLIDCLADVTSNDMDISRGELWDILDKMNVSAYAVFPVHALLSCLRPADAGPMAPPGMRFLHEILSREIIPTMHRRVEQATENLIGVFTDRRSSRKVREQAQIKSSAVICTELSRLKQLHQGTLPHPDLVEMWNSFFCDEVLTTRDVD